METSSGPTVTGLWYPALKDVRDEDHELTLDEVRGFIPNMKGKKCTFEHIPTAVIGTIKDAWLEGRAAFVKFDTHNDEPGKRAYALINHSLRSQRPLALSATHLIHPDQKRTFVEMSVVSEPRRTGAQITKLSRKVIRASAIGADLFPSENDGTAAASGEDEEEEEEESAYKLVTASGVPLDVGVNAPDTDDSFPTSRSSSSPPRAHAPDSSPTPISTDPSPTPPSLPPPPPMSNPVASVTAPGTAQAPSQPSVSSTPAPLPALGTGQVVPTSSSSAFSNIVEQVTQFNQQQQQQQQPQQQHQQPLPDVPSSRPSAPLPDVPPSRPSAPFPEIDGVRDPAVLDMLKQIWNTPGLPESSKEKAIAALALKHIEENQARERLESNIRHTAARLGDNPDELLRVFADQSQREILLNQLQLRERAMSGASVGSAQAMASQPPAKLTLDGLRNWYAGASSSSSSSSSYMPGAGGYAVPPAGFSAPTGGYAVAPERAHPMGYDPRAAASAPSLNPPLNEPVVVTASNVGIDKDVVVEFRADRYKMMFPDSVAALGVKVAAPPVAVHASGIEDSDTKKREILINPWATLLHHASTSMQRNPMAPVAQEIEQ